MDDPTPYALERLAARGFDKAQVHYAVNERDELQAELGKPSMLRTVANACPPRQRHRFSTMRFGVTLCELPPPHRQATGERRDISHPRSPP